MPRALAGTALPFRYNHPEELDAIVAKRYPTPAAFQADLPRILTTLGFAPDKAAWLADHIVVDPSRGVDAPADVLIEGRRILDAARGLAGRPGLRGVPRLSARGCWVLPGLIDLHVHLRQSPAETAEQPPETIASGAAAAVAGGFTTICATRTCSVPTSKARPSSASPRRSCGVASRSTARRSHRA